MKYTILLVAAVLVMGCGHKKEVVYEYDDEANVNNDVYITEPPPPLIVESCPPCPNSEFVWIGGFWIWDGHHYAWRKGYWGRPRHHGEYWYGPRYEKHKHGYRYVPGYWDKKPPKHHDEPKKYNKPKHHDEPKKYNKPKHHDEPKKYNKPKHHDEPKKYNKPKRHDEPRRHNEHMNRGRRRG